MVKAAPSAAFVVSEPDLLLEFLVVALDAPAQLGEVDQSIEDDFFRQVREPVTGRFGFALRPFDQQPLGRMRRVPSIVVMGRAYPQPARARAKPVVGAFTPSDRAPTPFRLTQGQLLDRYRLVGVVTTQPGRAGGRAPHKASGEVAPDPAAIRWWARECRPRSSCRVRRCRR